MLQQLEAAHLLSRSGDGRLYGTGLRLRRLAENLLLNDTAHGARHAVLRKLVGDVGESCNLTALSGSEVIYLDRVETPAPLRFYLHPGSRVPVHCSASGKIFLSQMTPGQRQRLEELARQVNGVLRPFFAGLELELVDFKIELGFAASGELLLADEISPDTCRLWNTQVADLSDRILDKDRFRQDLGGVVEAYGEVCKRVQGACPEPRTYR